jgi:uncharacterized membrane protein
MLKERIKKYSFWTGLSAALVVLANVIGKSFGLSINNQTIEDIVMAICGLLIALGVVCIPKKDSTCDEDTQTQDDITSTVDQQTQNDVTSATDKQTANSNETSKENE